jgi:hypothetical protein
MQGVVNTAESTRRCRGGCCRPSLRSLTGTFVQILMNGEAAKAQHWVPHAPVLRVGLLSLPEVAVPLCQRRAFKSIRIAVFVCTSPLWGEALALSFFPSFALLFPFAFPTMPTKLSARLRTSALRSIDNAQICAYLAIGKLSKCASSLKSAQKSQFRRLPTEFLIETQND